MIRKIGSLAAALMVCLPLGGGRLALANYVERADLSSVPSSFWLGPGQLVALCGCLVALCVLAGLNRR
jgi:hypothetical protein